MKDWPTREEDMRAARLLMEEYANKQEVESLSLFELTVDLQEKAMGFRLAKWVLELASHYSTVYGADQGDYVIRKVIGQCMTEGQVLH